MHFFLNSDSKKVKNAPQQSSIPSTSREVQPAQQHGGQQRQPQSEPRKMQPQHQGAGSRYPRNDGKFSFMRKKPNYFI